MILEKHKEDGYIITHCKNNVDLFNYIQKRIKEKGEDYWDHIGVSKEGGSWFGGVNYSQAMNNLIFGNKDTTQKFLDGLNDSRKEVDTYNNIFLDTEGFAYDMGAVVEGDPNCCLNSIGEAPKKTINIGFPFSYHCGNKSDVIAWRGMAVTNLIYTLMNKGYIVNVKILGCYKPQIDIKFDGDSEHYYRSFFDMDLPVENLCIGTIAFYCSVEFFRIIMILAQSMFCEQPTYNGYGKGTRDIDDFYSIYGKDMFIIPDGYMSDEMEKLTSQQHADSVVTRLFNEYCEKEGICI